ncbi:hypothetical protein M8818_005525 [Zalaria obscura]|uniref:Uncharacterized protein n=1 Tax=Zalaria obscura TaxID=2024903 RepID=A0ACC3SBB7_9PEZI
MPTVHLSDGRYDMVLKCIGLLWGSISPDFLDTPACSRGTPTVGHELVPVSSSKANSRQTRGMAEHGVLYYIRKCEPMIQSILPRGSFTWKEPLARPSGSQNREARKQESGTSDAIS